MIKSIKSLVNQKFIRNDAWRSKIGEVIIKIDFVDEFNELVMAMFNDRIMIEMCYNNQETYLI